MADTSSLSGTAPPGILTVEPMIADDWPAVRRIYGEGIATGNATLETEVPSWAAFDSGHRRDCRLVARLDGEIVGWIALTGYSRRRVYRGVAWESVYVAERRGVAASVGS